MAVHEAQCISSYVFVGSLQVETNRIAVPRSANMVPCACCCTAGHAPDQYPLLAQLALGVVFGAHLEEEVHELLQRLRLARHDKADDVHEQAGLRVAVEHDGENLLLQTG